MGKDYTGMLDELRTLKMKTMEICSALTQEISKEPILMEAVRSGLMKPNFPTPPGFMRMIRMGSRSMGATDVTPRGYKEVKR